MNKEFEKMQKLAFGKELITENNIKTKSALKAKIAEMFNEAKKKKDKDVIPQEDVDVNIDAAQSPEDTVSPETSTSTDIDPTVKSIQDSLQKAFANAKTLGDEKLIAQIGNTITMLVRTQVLGAQGINENEESGDFNKFIEAIKDYDFNKAFNVAQEEGLFGGDFSEYIESRSHMGTDGEEIAETAEKLKNMVIEDLKAAQDDYGMRGILDKNK